MHHLLKINLISVFFIGLGLFAFGCGGSFTGTNENPAQATLSCNQASVGKCLDYGAGFTASASQTACTNIGGTYSTTSVCTSTSRVGTCETTSNSQTTTINYYSGQFNVSSATTDCGTQPGGTFKES